MLQYPQKITLCGFGGQGIILTAVMLGTAAVTKGGLYAVQTQSYGSEARGGQCQAELIIDKTPINSPVAQEKNLLVALFQSAYEKYIPTLDENGVLVIDPQLVTNLTRPIAHTFAVPATRVFFGMTMLPACMGSSRRSFTACPSAASGLDGCRRLSCSCPLRSPFLPPC